MWSGRNMSMNAGYSRRRAFVFAVPVITVTGPLLQPESYNIQAAKDWESSEWKSRSLHQASDQRKCWQKLREIYDEWWRREMINNPYSLRTRCSSKNSMMLFTSFLALSLLGKYNLKVTLWPVRLLLSLSRKMWSPLVLTKCFSHILLVNQI